MDTVYSKCPSCLPSIYFCQDAIFLDIVSSSVSTNSSNTTFNKASNNNNNNNNQHPESPLIASNLPYSQLRTNCGIFLRIIAARFSSPPTIVPLLIAPSAKGDRHKSRALDLA
jgi:hypothetical protein